MQEVVLALDIGKQSYNLTLQTEVAISALTHQESRIKPLIDSELA